MVEWEEHPPTDGEGKGIIWLIFFCFVVRKVISIGIKVSEGVARSYSFGPVKKKQSNDFSFYSGAMNCKKS